MSHDQTNRERLIDEMAVTLCAMPKLDDDTACIIALMEQGFRAAVIVVHFDEALKLARMVRARQYA